MNTSKLITPVVVCAILLAFALIIEASDSSTVSYNTNQNITAHSTCRKVTNNSATGLSVYVPTVTSAEWASFYGSPPSGVTIADCATTIEVAPAGQTVTNVNLCTLAGNPTTAGSYVFIIPAGTTVGSNDASQPALTTGTCWPAGSTLTLINNGNIYGKGGNGGNGGSYPSSNNGASGATGGAAISLGYALTINNTNGNIFGGGGGGGGGAIRGGVRGQISGGGGGGGAQGFGTSLGGTGGPGTGGSYIYNGSSGGSGTLSSPGSGGNGGAGNVGNVGGSGGSGGSFGSSGSSGGVGSGPGSAFSPGSGGSGGTAVQLNGNTVTWLGGNDSTHVKGLVQ